MCASWNKLNVELYRFSAMGKRNNRLSCRPKCKPVWFKKRMMVESLSSVCVFNFGLSSFKTRTLIVCVVLVPTPTLPSILAHVKHRIIVTLIYKKASCRKRIARPPMQSILKKVKSFFAHTFVKMDRFTSNQDQWSATHSCTVSQR